MEIRMSRQLKTVLVGEAVLVLPCKTKGYGVFWWKDDEDAASKGMKKR